MDWICYKSSDICMVLPILQFRIQDPVSKFPHITILADFMLLNTLYRRNVRNRHIRLFSLFTLHYFENFK